MDGDADRPIEQLRKLLAEIESLAGTLSKAAAEASGEGQPVALERLRATMNAACSRIKDAEQELERHVGQGAKAADDFVHDNTWISIGIAAAVAFLLGALSARREHEPKGSP